MGAASNPRLISFFITGEIWYGGTRVRAYVDLAFDLGKDTGGGNESAI